MTSSRVVSVDGRLAILLPPDVIERFSWQEGDTMKVEPKDGTLFVTRTLTAKERAERIRAATEEVLQRRGDVY